MRGWKMFEYFKKSFTVCLLLSLLLTGFVGCQSEKPDTSESIPAASESESTSETAAAEISYYDELGEMDFEGKIFSIIGVDYATRRNFPNEDESGEVVNDALAERDSFIEETYNVSISYSKYEKPDEIGPIVQNEVLSGENNYHLVIARIAAELKTLMLGKVLYDLNELPYADMSAGWWSPYMFENTSINEKLYITMGDISPQKYYAPYVLAFNKKLAEDNHFPDLYTHVLEGKWDLDEFASLIKDSNRDLNGDGTMDHTDFWGYAHVNTYTTGVSHFVGAGGVPSEIKNGEIIVDLNNEKSFGIVEKLNGILTEVKYTDMAQTNDMFTENRALFYGNSMSNIIANFRSMESDFGIIPVPKYDESQDSYYAYINTWCLGGSSVPLTCSDTEMTGFLMEAMCYKSYETVRPALFENLIKEKVSRDDKSSQILDIVYDITYLDLNGIFDFGKSNTFVGNAVALGGDYVSGIAALEQSIPKDIENVLNELG